VDGFRVASGTVTNNFTRRELGIGDFPVTQSESMDGFISNARFVKGSSVYDPTALLITIPTSPLENITEDVVDILDRYSETTSFSNSKKLDEDGEKNGKTYKSTSPSKKVNLKPNEETNFVNKARTLTKRISGLLYTNENIVDVESLFDDSDLFESMIGETIDNFKILLDSGFIDVDELNETITSVNLQFYHV
jgi:hypothetical protein